MKKHYGLIISIVLILFISFFLWRWANNEWFGWTKLSYGFSEDENGQLASQFFPDFQSFPGSIKQEFEHMTIYRYPHNLHEKIYDLEIYFLKLDFESSAEYEHFLEETEKNYSDMTSEQRIKSDVRIESSRFEVGRYSFRAIDVSPFGPANSDYVGLIAHCDSDNTIVFLYYWDYEFSFMDDLKYELEGIPCRYSKLWDDD